MDRWAEIRDRLTADATRWTAAGDRHVMNGDDAAANVAYTVATEKSDSG